MACSRANFTFTNTFLVLHCFKDLLNLLRSPLEVMGLRRVEAPAAGMEWLWPRTMLCWPFVLSGPFWGLPTFLVQAS